METPLNKINMTEGRFWELVELAKWPCDCEKMKIKYRVMLSKKECSEFRIYLDRARYILNNLEQKITDIGGDGYNDLLYICERKTPTKLALDNFA